MLGAKLVATGFVVTENSAEEDPAETVTLAGTVAAEVLLDESMTTAPPVGAAALSATVACDAAPPTTLIGLSEIEETVMGAASTDSIAA
jgi:hypothetical protein